MSSEWLRAAGRVFGDTASKVFLHPVRDGRPHFREWPAGLFQVVVLTGFAYAVASVLILASGWLRTNDVLVVNFTQSMPTWSITVMLWLVVWTMCLAITGALHAHVVIRIVTLAVMILPIAIFVIPYESRLIGLGALAALLVFAILRWRGQYAWFEFPVVTVLVAVAVFSGVGSSDGATVGFDLRPMALQSLLGGIIQLAIPALVMAGYAPVQIAVTLGEGLVERIRVETTGGRWRLGVVAVLVAVGTVWLANEAIVGILEESFDWRARSIVGSCLIVAVGCFAAWLMLRRSPGRPPIGPTAEVWGPYTYPLVIMWVGIIIPIGLFAVGAGVFALLTGQGDLTVVTGRIASSPIVFGSLRFLIMGVALWLLVRARRRGERVAPVLLLSFIGLALPGAVSTISGAGIPIDWSFPALTTAALALAWLLLVVALIRRQGIERQLWVTLLVVLVGTTVGLREVLADPANLVAGVSGLAVVLLGLVWRVLTDADITRTGSTAFPVPSRILFYAANALLAAVALAYLALTRMNDSLIDVESHAELGANLVGAPLVLGSLTVALLSTLLIRRQQPVPRTVPQDHPSDLQNVDLREQPQP